MKIHTSEDAFPKVMHKSVAVALHWRDQVKADLDADVKRGCLLVCQTLGARKW